MVVTWDDFSRKERGPVSPVQVDNLIGVSLCQVDRAFEGIAGDIDNETVLPHPKHHPLHSAGRVIG